MIFSKGWPVRVRRIGVLPDRAAATDEGERHGADANRADGLLLQLLPKKNMIAAPKAGAAG